MIDIDARRLADALTERDHGTNNKREASLKARFPVPTSDELIEEPTLFVDRGGVILVWYLPDVLSGAFQVGS